MKKFVRPILEVFFIILALSLSFSMKNSRRSRMENQVHLAQVQRETQALSLQKADLERRFTLAQEPAMLEQSLRESQLVRLPGEDNLDLADFQYQPRHVPEFTPPVLSYQEQWQQLLFP